LAAPIAADRVHYRTPPVEDDRVRVAWVDGPWVYADTFDDGLRYAVVASGGFNLDAGLWRDVVRLDPCCYCGGPVTPHLLPDGSLSRDRRRGTVEHLIAKSEGGRGLDGNTVGACARCNHARHGLTLLDMLLRNRDGVTTEGLARYESDRRAA
jgi:5-methylcytosine-specific restriction endonuclease McrA